MTATNHALTGATIAVIVRQPVLALPLALLSHFVCDAIPHWNYDVKFPKRQIVITADLILALIVVTIIAANGNIFGVQAWVVVACAGLAVLPDAMWLPHILKGQPIPRDTDHPLYLAREFHRRIQWSETQWGFFVEVVWFVLLLSYVFAKYHSLAS